MTVLIHASVRWDQLTAGERRPTILEQSASATGPRKWWACGPQRALSHPTKNDFK
jgi:hypothetical protein